MEKDVVVEMFIHQFDKVVAVYRRLLIELYLYCAFCGFDGVDRFLGELYFDCCNIVAFLVWFLLCSCHLDCQLCRPFQLLRGWSKIESPLSVVSGFVAALTAGYNQLLRRKVVIISFA